MTRRISNRILKTLDAFIKMEAASGIILACCTAIAMLLANSVWSADYFEFLHVKIFGLSLQHWINDGLMAIFFFVIGMEIKKELVAGELSSFQKAVLPAAAALGGMVVPAFIYFYFNQSPPNSNGWGIPMATDIAFALGVLTLFGKRVPLSLKVFLLALAIVDDLGAVLVIALFYTKQINVEAIGIAALLFLIMFTFKNLKFKNYFIYLILGVAIWSAVLLSGVHATVAGVLIGLMTPLKFQVSKSPSGSYSPLEDLIHALHPWVSFGIMPVFALANAGILLEGLEFSKIITNPIHQGVALGLLLGKPIGIMGFSYLAVKLGLGRLPAATRWPHIFAVSFLAGIGFTMALFISNLALAPDQEIYSKTGILLGSVLAGVLGFILLFFALKNQNERQA